uniref:(northern house mosquito) hypothetical protein n=1 Tax=Culex pipiens TaxID=7175 RepID=A0A8D8ANC9_CULPI
MKNSRKLAFFSSTAAVLNLGYMYHGRFQGVRKKKRDCLKRPKLKRQNLGRPKFKRPNFVFCSEGRTSQKAECLKRQNDYGIQNFVHIFTIFIDYDVLKYSKLKKCVLFCNFKQNKYIMSSFCLSLPIILVPYIQVSRVEVLKHFKSVSILLFIELW